MSIRAMSVSNGLRPISSLAGRSIPVEIGCSDQTALVAPADAGAWAAEARIGLENATVAISAASAASARSDFARCGGLRRLVPTIDGGMLDELGIIWSADKEGRRCASAHPLDAATAGQIRAYPLPDPSDRLQVVDTPDLLAIFDPAFPGLIETCFSLRGGWNFLELCVEASPTASALLDWAQRALVERYYALLAALPASPSCILYRDEWGNEVSPYFSAKDFERLIWPRLGAIFAEIRTQTSAPIAVQIRGASRPLLKNLVDNGIEVIGVDCNARGMVSSDLRRDLGREIVLHGTADLWALGSCLSTGNLRGTALLACELAAAMPVIAAPAAPLANREAIEHVARAAAFLNALDEDDLDQLAHFGPVRDVIIRAMRSLPESFLIAPPEIIGIDEPSRSMNDSRFAFDDRNSGGKGQILAME